MNTMKYLLEAIAYLGFFTAVFLSFYFYLKFRNKERMAIIEKGGDATELYKQAFPPYKFPWIKTGIIILFLGFGLAFAFLFIVFPPPPFQNHPDLRNGNLTPTIILCSLLIFSGIGLILGNIFEKIGKKKNG